MQQTTRFFVVISALSVPWPAFAQTAPAPEAAPVEAAPAAPAPEPKKKGIGPALSISPDVPQVGGRVTSPAEAPPVLAAEPTAEWKFDVTGYFRAPMRMSWGPQQTEDINNPGLSAAGTQLRTPPMVPDANYIDWRYTNSLVAPWTELNFHYGNDRVKATVQIASYNLTDPGYRRLESNLGINQAFITMNWPELGGSDAWHLVLTVGGFTNRYGAAGRYDGGKYETYLFGRTHVAGFTINPSYDANDDWTFQFEGGFGAKLEPIPFFGPPLGLTATNANQQLPPWEPYPGPVAQESAFVAHAHLGAVWKREVLIGLHFIRVFANDNERSTSYLGSTFDTGTATMPAGGRGAGDPTPAISVAGGDVKLLGGVLGDGYAGYAHLSARNAMYIGDAIETIHSFGGWQLHDNYFGKPGGTEPVTGDVDTVAAQYVFSFGQLFYYPNAFWGQGPDLIVSLFGMYNHVKAPENPVYNNITKLKVGTDLTYLPLAWFGLGYRFDFVDPDFGKSEMERAATGAPGFMDKFMVFSPRLVFRTDFVTHEQILVQYSRYFFDDAVASMFPYNTQPGAGGIPSSDKNAFQVAAIIWF